MAKRLVTDAKIVLRNAGYQTEYIYFRNKVKELHVYGQGVNEALLAIGGLVENTRVEELLKLAGK